MITNLLNGNFTTRQNKIHHPAILFFSIFLIYILSAPRTVVLGDDGYFIMAAYFNGVAHPPGYPLYTLLAHISTYLPYGNIAYRVHLLSALFGSLTCISIWYIAQKLIPEKTYAYIAAIGFSLSKIFWGQSIIAEVYTLNTFLFFTTLIFLLEYKNNIQSIWLPRLIFLFYGLGLSNHWPLFLLSTPALIFLFLSCKKITLKLISENIFFLIVGLSPYMMMIIRSNTDAALSFYGPITSFNDFWFYISREAYSDTDISANADWHDKYQLSLFVLRETFVQFGYLGGVFVVFGAISQWRIWPRYICLAFSSTYVLNTFILVLLLGFEYDEVHRNVFTVYPLIAYGICGLWLALGFYSIVSWIRYKNHFLLSKFYINSFVVLLLGIILIKHAPVNYRANDHWAEDYALSVLESLPEESIFIGASDYVIGPLGYFHFVEGKRKDITLYNYTGQIFSNRLFNPIGTSWEKVNEKYEQLIKSEERPIYYSNYLPHTFGEELSGLYKKVLVDKPHNYRRINILPETLNSLHALISKKPQIQLDESIHAKRLTYDFCKILIGAVGYLDANNDIYHELLNKRCDNFYGSLAIMDHIVVEEFSANEAMIFKRMNMLDEYRDQSATILHTAMPEYYWGRYYLKKNQNEESKKYFSRSLEIFSGDENPSYSYFYGLK